MDPVNIARQHQLDPYNLNLIWYLDKNAHLYVLHLCITLKALYSDANTISNVSTIGYVLLSYCFTCIQPSLYNSC